MKSERNILSMIKGRLMSAAVAIVSLLTVASCADEVSLMPDNSDPKAGYITLNLFSTKTRADEDTIELDLPNLNEDLISNARIYFFPGDAAQDTDKPVHSIILRNLNVNESYTVSQKLTDEIVEKIFPGNSTTAQAYVLCNIVATNTQIPADPTLGDLKRIQVTSSFENAITPDNRANMFVMNGQNTVSLVRDVDNPSKSTVTGTVNLKRAAAKISLDVKLQESAEDSYGNTWVPVAGSMYALITNGVKTTYVTPSLYTPKAEDYYTTSTSDFGHRFNGPVADAEYPYQVQMPFYTYPNSWADDNEKMTYLTIMLPWRQQNGTVVRNCWYMVPVVKNETAITRNVSYHVKIDIGVLGSYEPEEPLEIQGSYEAVQWGDAPVNVDIKDYRYLVVDQQSYTVNNEPLANVSFYSSHEVEVTDVKMTYTLYNTNAAGIEKKVNVSMVQNSASAPYNNGHGLYWYELDNSVNSVTGTRSLEFDHPLLQWTPYSSNNIVVQTGPNADGTYPSAIESNIDSSIAYYRPTNDAAYSIYEFEITIQHKNHPEYSETIKITQYPAMYIQVEANKYVLEAATNSGNGTVRRPNQPIGSAEYGNVYINGNTRNTTYNSVSYCMMPSGLRGTNRNPNMYIISISQLGIDENKYRIGDPRTENIEIPTYVQNTADEAFPTNWIDAPALYGNSPRSLSFYYPTDDSENTKRYVAPKLRISSSYSVSQPDMTKEQAIARCAGYQELNYPAGRWRVPTYGELDYILSLSDSRTIPSLFASDEPYWTAHGVYYGSLENGSLKEYPIQTVGNVRCVYDEWIWGDSKVAADGTVTWAFTQANSNSFQGYTGQSYTTTKYPFTWGDAPRNENN